MVVNSAHISTTNLMITTWKTRT